jgi:epsilon-lactone hydrolase
VHHQAKARLVNCYAMWAELSASLDEPVCVPPCGEPLAAMLAIRDAGLPQPGCGWRISPWVDMEATGETMISKSTVDPTMQKAGILETARLYLNAADPRSPLAAPIYADLTGLAPLLIQVGAAETLLDDAIRLARVAGAADVRVDLQIWPE